MRGGCAVEADSGLDAEAVVQRKGDVGKVAGVVSIQTPGRDPAWTAEALDTRFGIQTRVGLHCAPSAHRTLGTFPTGTLRFSFGWFNTEADIDAAAAALDLLTREDAHGL